jgi:hypothetical protein
MMMRRVSLWFLRRRSLRSCRPQTFFQVSIASLIILIEKPGKGVYLLQKKIADRMFFKARKQFPLAIEPKYMI